METLLNKALRTAISAHEGQPDKAEKPYILHPLRVMLQFDDENSQVTALLHDVVEDSPITFEDLEKEGFPSEVLAALHCLTKTKGEDYDDFISRVLTDPLACRVKLADLMDNSDLSRLATVGTEDLDRVAKYARALTRIRQHLNSNENK